MTILIGERSSRFHIAPDGYDTQRRGSDRRQNPEGCERAGSAIPIPATTSQHPTLVRLGGPLCVAMDQAKEIELIRPGRKLAADSVRSEKESAIEHGSTMRPKHHAPSRIFQRMVATPLILCLSLREHFTLFPAPPLPLLRLSLQSQRW